jgi:hypothetical protein
MRTFSSLLVVTRKDVKEACHVGYRTAPILMCIAAKELCHTKEGSYICLPRKPSGPNLLEKPLKGFIVNPTDLPWKWVKRLATSGKRVNHGSQWKCTTSAECKTIITAVLMVTSGLKNSQNNGKLMEFWPMINDVFKFYLIIHVTSFMWLIGALINLLLQMLKLWLIKS